MPGSLFVVATPIGNLEDLTFRALRTLREADLIAAEDTRRTSKLLAHYEIRKPLFSLHEHNENRESAKLVGRMLAGESIALVTDAGTPGIADPGATLVRSARAAGVKIVPIPGPSAVVTAMSVAGAKVPEFSFFGFPPAKGSERTRWFERLARTDHPVVFFEAPHRITRTIGECKDILVKRHILITRELTKINEELVFRPIDGQFNDIKDIGEFCLVIIPDHYENKDKTDISTIQGQALDLFDSIAASPLISMDLALELTALKLDLSVTDAKKAIKKAKILAKQQNK